MIVILLTAAFLAGLFCLKIGFPPLLGYLLAGFVCYAFGLGYIGDFDTVAKWGVTMLLFTIGLKLHPKDIVQPYVVIPAIMHMVIVIPLTFAVIFFAGEVFPVLELASKDSAWVLAFALSFSSTVFAVKVFNDRGDTTSIYAVITIGILVIQDVLAVLYLAIEASRPPSLWAISLVLIAVFWRWISLAINRLIVAIGHGELQLLFGIVAAFGAYELFELVDIKGGLGALVAGALLSSASKEGASELYDRLLDFKDLFLVGFFMQIGYYGIPSPSMFVVAVALAALLFVRPLVYFILFSLCRLRGRTSWLAGSALFTYSEFGLIVASIGVASGLITDEWLVTLSLSIALSFFLATTLNRYTDRLYERFRPTISRYERSPHREVENFEYFDTTRIVVLGMGRVGRSAYEYMNSRYPSNVIGIEERFARAKHLKESGYNVVHGDASDQDFWEQTNLTKSQLILLSLTNHQENLSVLHLANRMGYHQKIAVAARFEDEVNELQGNGCFAYNLYADVGRGFAEYVDSAMSIDKIIEKS